jgi:hypothetical protein
MSRTTKIFGNLSIRYDVISNPNASDDLLFNLKDKIFNVSVDGGQPIQEYRIDDEFSIFIDVTNTENIIRHLMYESNTESYLYRFYEEEYTPSMLIEKYGDYIKTRTKNYYISVTHKVNDFLVKVYSLGTTIYFDIWYGEHRVYKENELVYLEICEMDDYMLKVSSLTGLRKLMEEVGERDITKVLFESLINVTEGVINFKCGNITRKFAKFYDLVYFIKNNFFA